MTNSDTNAVTGNETLQVSRSGTAVIETIWDRLWQPIETAPKDGTLIDLYLACPPAPNYARRVVDCWWSKKLNDWACDPEDRCNEWRVHPGGNYQITHWMYQPTAPK